MKDNKVLSSDYSIDKTISFPHSCSQMEGFLNNFGLFGEKSKTISVLYSLNHYSDILNCSYKVLLSNKSIARSPSIFPILQAFAFEAFNSGDVDSAIAVYKLLRMKDSVVNFFLIQENRKMVHLLKSGKKIKINHSKNNYLPFSFLGNSPRHIFDNDTFEPLPETDNGFSMSNLSIKFNPNDTSEVAQEKFKTLRSTISHSHPPSPNETLSAISHQQRFSANTQTLRQSLKTKRPESNKSSGHSTTFLQEHSKTDVTVLLSSDYCSIQFPPQDLPVSRIKESSSPKVKKVTVIGSMPKFNEIFEPYIDLKRPEEFHSFDEKIPSYEAQIKSETEFEEMNDIFLKNWGELEEEKGVEKLKSPNFHSVKVCHNYAEREIVSQKVKERIIKKVSIIPLLSGSETDKNTNFGFCIGAGVSLVERKEQTSENKVEEVSEVKTPEIDNKSENEAQRKRRERKAERRKKREKKKQLKEAEIFNAGSSEDEADNGNFPKLSKKGSFNAINSGELKKFNNSSRKLRGLTMLYKSIDTIFFSNSFSKAFDGIENDSSDEENEENAEEKDSNIISELKARIFSAWEDSDFQTCYDLCGELLENFSSDEKKILQSDFTDKEVKQILRFANYRKACYWILSTESEAESESESDKKTQILLSKRLCDLQLKKDHRINCFKQAIEKCFESKNYITCQKLIKFVAPQLISTDIYDDKLQECEASTSTDTNFNRLCCYKCGAFHSSSDYSCPCSALTYFDYPFAQITQNGSFRFCSFCSSCFSTQDCLDQLEEEEKDIKEVSCLFCKVGQISLK